MPVLWGLKVHKSLVNDILPWFPLLQTYPPTALQRCDCQYKPLGSAGVGEGIHWIPRHIGEYEEESLTSASAGVCPGSHAGKQNNS